MLLCISDEKRRPRTYLQKLNHEPVVSRLIQNLEERRYHDPLLIRLIQDLRVLSSELQHRIDCRVQHLRLARSVPFSWGDYLLHIS